MSMPTDPQEPVNPIEPTVSSSNGVPSVQPTVYQPSVPQQQPVVYRETNMMAIIGFVLSITCMGLGIGSLIVSIIALNQINKQPNKYQGKALAIWGIALSILEIVGALIFILLSIFVISTAVKNGNLNTGSTDSGSY